jgi:isopentenyl-diphosphate delta-isomerase
VRESAPDVLLLGNIGLVQAVQSTTAAIEKLISTTGIDALCIHLNPAMEVVQPEGDDDFRGGLQCIKRLTDSLSVPVIIKETGCGISRSVAQRVSKLGIKTLDVSGAGGTSWVAVETHRAQNNQRSLGELYWDWGIPTAASVAQLSDLNLEICATGGIKNGLMIVKALALGATCGGIARVVLQAYADGGKEGAKSFLQQTIEEIRIGLLLCGASNIKQLQTKPLIVHQGLRQWIPKNSSIRERLLQ